MFTARCALNTYIKHISFVFKRLIQNSVERVSMKQLTSFVLWRVIPVTAGIVGLNAVERTVSPVKKQQCSSVLVCGSYERVIFLGCTSCKKKCWTQTFQIKFNYSPVFCRFGCKSSFLAKRHVEPMHPFVWGVGLGGCVFVLRRFETT